MNIKLFCSDTSEAVQREANAWLADNRDIEVKDFRLSTCYIAENASIWYTLAVVYQDTEGENDEHNSK